MFFKDGEIQFSSSDRYRTTQHIGRGRTNIVTEECVVLFPDGRKEYKECSMNVIAGDDNAIVEFYRSHQVGNRYLSPDEKDTREDRWIQKDIIEKVLVPLDGTSVPSSSEKWAQVRENGVKVALSQWREKHAAKLVFEGKPVSYYSRTISDSFVYEDEEIPGYAVSANLPIRCVKLQEPVNLELQDGHIRPIWEDYIPDITTHLECDFLERNLYQVSEAEMERLRKES